jgi:hypothetical protein
MKICAAILLGFFVVASQAATQSGTAIEKCVYGEGEAQVTVTLHKPAKKGEKMTADITQGTKFKRLGIESNLFLA